MGLAQLAVVTAIFVGCTGEQIRQPYIVPMMLGRSYNALKSTMGVDIFSKDTIAANINVTSAYSFKAYYQVIKSGEDVNKLLDIKGDFSLNVLTGKVQVSGAGSYLKETIDRTKTVEILVHAVARTVDKQLRTDSQLQAEPGWLDTDIRVLGTHYVNTISYGGELVASLKLISDDETQHKKIFANVTGALTFGSFNGSIAAQLDLLQKNSQGRTRLEISYYATTEVAGTPTSIDELLKLIDSFETDFKKVGDGEQAIGSPQTVTLFDLNTLITSAQLLNFIRNDATMSMLHTFRERYEDLKRTSKAFRSWASATTKLLPEDMEKLTVFTTKIEDLSQIFFRTAYNLDVTKDIDQFDEAKAAYESGGPFLASKYFLEFQHLKKEVLQNQASACFDLKNGLGVPEWNLQSEGSFSNMSHSAHNLKSCQVNCILANDCYSITFTNLTFFGESEIRCFLNRGKPNAFVQTPTAPIEARYYVYNRKNCPVTG